jgi:prepilin-type N-terminal cleavage/methylation domain-containing protein
MKKNSGFTLIELLIVICIIGILSTIILSSLSNSRAKAYDSKVKQQLNSFRTAAELYFTNQDRYNEVQGVPISECSTGMFNNFDAENSSPGLYIADGNLPDFSVVKCGSTDSTYAVKATLYSGNEYWCVDNKGASRLIPGTPTSGTFCP